MVPSKKDEEEALNEWRRRHWHELDLSMAVLVSIRDDSLIAKDRIEAIKGITRMLGALSNRPTDSAKPLTDPTAKKAVVMSDEEAEDVKAILSTRRYAKAIRPTD